LAHLGSCTLGEEIVYSPKPFPSPPFPANWPTSDVDAPMWAGTAGAGDDNHQVPGNGVFVTPYSDATGTGSQMYWYECNCSGGTRFILDGPYSIVRRVYFDGGVWKYSVSKAGYSSSMTLP
jgi:hypothetical protein